MKEKIVVFGEVDKNQVCSSTLEAITCAKQLSPNAELTVVVCGEKGQTNGLLELLHYKITQLIIYETTEKKGNYRCI